MSEMQVPTGLPPRARQEVIGLPDVTKDVIAQRMRMAKLPEVYCQLVAQIKACEDLLQIEYFSDAAEALAAFAKIHKDNKLLNQAKRLKAWAAWAAGRAAQTLRPGGVVSAKTSRANLGVAGRAKGARSVLVEQGLSKSKAQQVLSISRLTEQEIWSLLNKPRAPGFLTLSVAGKGRGLSSRAPMSDAAAPIIASIGSGGHPANLRSHAHFCRTASAKAAARFTPQEAKRARELLLEIQEWHDEFEASLPQD